MSTSPAKSGRTKAGGNDVGASRLARVYAQALLDASDAAGCRAGVLEELSAIAGRVLPQVPGAERVFASPRIPVEEKERLIDTICGDRVLPTTLHTLHVLARHDRLGLLADIVDAAVRLAEERDGLVRAEFITAAPLDPAERDRVVADAAAALGLRLAPTFTVDPDLLGGLVLRVGDTIHDHSVATGLRRLGDRLKQRSIHEIQYGRDRLGTA